MRRVKLVLALGLLAGALWIGRAGILTWVGSYLVDIQEPRSADVIIVLGGDGTGARALKGCQLLDRGLANQIWISGANSFYGKAESELAVEFVGKHGCPVDKITALKNPVDSTRDEAIAIGKMMRDRGFKKYLLVTSNFHTKRAGKVFRENSPDLEAIVVAADDDEFPVDHWWQIRRARKTAFYEWLKTVSYWVGM